MNIKEFKRPTTTSDGVVILDHVTPDEYEFISHWCDLVGEQYPFESYLEYVLMKIKENRNETIF